MESIRRRTADLEVKVQRKKRIKSLLTRLYSERTRLEQVVEHRAHELMCENADVEKLKGRSPAAFFYMITGKKRELLEKETAEALQAQAMYEAAKIEYDAVCTEIGALERELRCLGNCDLDYTAALDELRQTLSAAEGETGERARALEAKIAELEERLREIAEAYDAGEKAHGIAKGIAHDLSDARTYGTWDLVRGGVLISMMKYDSLDAAQNKLEVLQKYLVTFRTELCDISADIQTDLHVNIGGTTRTLDVWFDNLFTDYSVLSCIEYSSEEIDRLLDRLHMALHEMDNLRVQIEKQRSELEMQLRMLMENI